MKNMNQNQIRILIAGICLVIFYLVWRTNGVERYFGFIPDAEPIIVEEVPQEEPESEPVIIGGSEEEEEDTSQWLTTIWEGFNLGELADDLMSSGDFQQWIPGDYLVVGEDLEPGVYKMTVNPDGLTDGCISVWKDSVLGVRNIIFENYYYAKLEEGMNITFWRCDFELIDEANREKVDIPQEQDEKIYRVGIDLEPGDYVIYQMSDWNSTFYHQFGSIEDMLEGSSQYMRIYQHNSFVHLEDGQYLQVVGGYLEPLTDAYKISPDGSGSFRVGIDIPAGTYTIRQFITGDKDAVGYISLYEDWKTHGRDPHNLIRQFTDSISLTLEDGQFVQLVDCFIMRPSE